MSDSPNERNKFNGIAQDLAGSESDTTDSDTDDSNDLEPSPSASDDIESEGQDSTSTEAEQAHGDPPFTYDDVDLEGYYVRQDETFAPISEMRSIVKTICAKEGLPEEELAQRELHDAELTVLQNTEDWGARVAIMILERRGVDIDEDRVREMIDFLTD